MMPAMPPLVIGKAYNRSTQQLMALLDNLNCPYTFSDIDFNLDARNFINSHKILSIPVLIMGEDFIVGFEEKACKTFITSKIAQAKS